MTIKELLKQADTVLKDEKLREMFKRCFLSTLETSVKREGDKTYIITGDINAMWLRDSSCQVNHYLKYIHNDSVYERVIFFRRRYEPFSTNRSDTRQFWFGSPQMARGME